MALSKITNASVADTAVHGRRNLIINGGMQVAQRGTSVTGLESGQGRTCDRIGTYINNGTWTVTQETDAPDGFSNSFKLLATAVESFVADTQLQIFYQIEGQDLQGVAKGTSSAKEMTLSWWCKSNKTGTHAVAFRDQDNARVCTKYFTINSADTWEYKTLNIPADTTGEFSNDNGASVNIEMWMGGGSDYTSGTPTGEWEAFSNSIRVGDGHTATVGTAVNDYFQITGYQLEIGGEATPFEHRSYGEELALCQRYYYQIGDSSTYTVAIITKGYDGKSTVPWHHPQSMRASPTMTTLGSDNSGTGTIISYVSIDENGCRQQAYQASDNTFIVYSFKADAEL